ncbi:hypothetical protein [Opitutus sp. ER46]|uniref:hypothetical protein n=1 Tax=Opitutus sp. ER46 TaxID=2161864 RepID=UPI000D301591|nr:hypothetical protein [Opitutus sp. ER46]PTX95491.1 hypothetical protein DB354_08675 [Opitutus sp. ER46]
MTALLPLLSQLPGTGGHAWLGQSVLAALVLALAGMLLVIAAVALVDADPTTPNSPASGAGEEPRVAS